MRSTHKTSFGADVFTIGTGLTTGLTTILATLVATLAAVPSQAQAEPPVHTCQTDTECGEDMACVDITCTACGPDCTVCEGICAQADPPCQTDLECGDGFVCEQACLPCAPDAPDCPGCLGHCVSSLAQPPACLFDSDCGEGSVCDNADSCGASCRVGDPTCDGVDCEIVEGVCVPAEDPFTSCEEDADCTEGQTCISRVLEVCVDSGVACTTEAVSFCGPRWQAPCENDVDCGEGFSCDAAELCGCRASDGTTDPSCNCVTTAERSCVLIEAACIGDDECPEALVCASSSDVAPCAIDAEGNGDCTSRSTQSICAPEGFIGASRASSEITDNTDGPPDDEQAAGFVFGCQGTASTMEASFAAMLLALGLRRRR